VSESLPERPSPPSTLLHRRVKEMRESETHVHRHPSQRLPAPQIVQTHRPVTPRTRQHARLTLIERNRDDVLSDGRIRRRVELERREGGGFRLVPDFDEVRGGGEDGVVAVVGDGVEAGFTGKGLEWLQEEKG
jgi:hypothetical protein